MTQDQLAEVMRQIEQGGKNKAAQSGDEEEEELEEDVKMENVRATYDLFIQNQLRYTSHTLEWLPIGHTDPDNSKFDYQYFLLGTHHDAEETTEPMKDQLQLTRVRVPNCSLSLAEL